MVALKRQGCKRTHTEPFTRKQHTNTHRHHRRRTRRHSHTQASTHIWLDPDIRFTNGGFAGLAMSGWEGVGALSGELFSRNVVQNTFGRGLSNLSALSQSLGSFLESCVPQEPEIFLMSAFWFNCLLAI